MDSSSNQSVASQEPIPANEDPCHRWSGVHGAIAQMSLACNLDRWD